MIYKIRITIIEMFSISTANTRQQGNASPAGDGRPCHVGLS